MKIEMKIPLTLQNEMKKLFELKNKVTNTGAPDAQIVFLKATLLQYEQILLTKNLHQYLETILISSKVLRMGIQETTYQKTYEMEIGSEEFMVGLKGCDRQLDWLEIFLVYEKRDKHLTIYDSYNAECAVQKVKSTELASISEVYSVTNAIKFDTSNDTQKHMLWKQSIDWHCKSYNTAPVSDYINNPIFQELSLEKNYFSDESEERVYIDLRAWAMCLGYTTKIEKPSRNDSKLMLTIKLKAALTKKNRLRVWG